ncbi:unnamed protein product [Closterium sp. Naga37s-1]|nr:unnamed protein product [Closterium sp. Naga37s-1]CAI5524190.1 unnamed protein product [Closterium sp. Naga37s-1]
MATPALDSSSQRGILEASGNCVPLTELLRGQGRTTTLLLLARATTGATPLQRPATSSTATPTASTASAASTAAAASTASSTAASSATSATTATAAAASASTAATEPPTPTSTSTATPTPPTASTSTSTARSSSSLAPLALARAASPARGRHRTDRLKTKEVGRSSRGNRGQQGGGRTPLKDGGARVTSRGSYSDYALFYREEGLLEEVYSECGGTD